MVVLILAQSLMPFYTTITTWLDRVKDYQIALEIS
jgi:hypothetical protein